MTTDVMAITTTSSATRPMSVPILEEFSAPLLRPPHPVLWTGRTPVAVDPLTLNGRINGYLPFRKPRGRCWLRLTGPSLWFFAAEALGFTVSVALCPRGAFADVMREFFPSVTIRPPAVGRVSSAKGKGSHCDVVFGDWSAVGELPGYWLRCLPTPHVLCCSPSRPHRLPTYPGWSFVRHTFAHSDMGGATDRSDSLILATPTRLRPMLRVSPLLRVQPSLPSQPWAPLRGSLDPVTSAEPAGPPDTGHLVQCAVLRVGSDVCPFGLFPHAHPTAVVRVPCVYNKPTRWGRRSLTPGELAALMDVPILLQNDLVKMDRRSVLSQLGGVVPGKTLLLGGDFLLGNFIRGGVVHFEECW